MNNFEDIIKVIPQKPYFRDLTRDIVIYCDDCRNILSHIPDKVIDLVLIDPPYGVGLDYLSYNDTQDNWRELMDFIIPWGIKNVGMCILSPGGISSLGYIYQNYPPDWLICWYKGAQPAHCYIGFSHWEPQLVYGKNKGVKFPDYFFALPEMNKKINHPCPKPLKWGLHLIHNTTQYNDLVLDPFLGSGTTVYCAKKLGRKCIGIEIEEKYCEVSANRCRQTVMDLKI